MPPDYYVQACYQSVKPGLHIYKTKQETNVLHHCPTVYTALTDQQRKNALDTALAGVRINEAIRVRGWDPTDIVRLLPPSHKVSDSLLSNFLLNKIFLMIEEHTLVQGKPVHTCNMDVHQRMTEPSHEVFLKCQYDQIYANILDDEVILCPYLDGDHWCLVAIFLKIKRMVYLDSLFRGIGTKRAFENLGNFLFCAIKLRGEVYGVEEWQFIIIPANDIAQQLNSVDCGVFVAKWAQHIAEGRVLDFNHQQIDDFRYSLILNIAENKLSCLSTPVASIDSCNIDGQEMDSDAVCFKATQPKHDSTIFEEHCYAHSEVKVITDEPKRDGLPQHVQKILPASTVYKCLEYEEYDQDSDNTEFKKFRVKYNVKICQRVRN